MAGARAGGSGYVRPMSAPDPTCPICKAPTVDVDRAVRPFCSQRCKLLDLDRWLSGDYRIPGEPVPEDALSPGPPEEG